MVRQTKWSTAESIDSTRAVWTGLNEITDFFKRKKSAAGNLKGDAVESLLDLTYSASNMPELRAEAEKQARYQLRALLSPELKRKAESVTCDESQYLLTLSNYTGALYGASTELRHLTALTDAAFSVCESLEGTLGLDYRRAFESGQLSTDTIWDLVMWSIDFTDAEPIPGLTLPDGAVSLAPDLWHFLKQYPLRNADTFEGGAASAGFWDTGYLATHIAYIPTGYGRYRIYVGDSPPLYRFFRENFYSVLDAGPLDLLAEFVDLFRQYGCTEETDLQVRDGTRRLMQLFHSAGDSWMHHREPDDEEEVSDYHLVHKAWTGISGVRSRIPDEPLVGTYGAIVRNWLEQPDNKAIPYIRR